MVRIKDLFKQEIVNKASEGHIKTIILWCIITIFGTGAMAAAIRYFKRRVLKATIAGNFRHE